MVFYMVHYTDDLIVSAGSEGGSAADGADTGAFGGA